MFDGYDSCSEDTSSSSSSEESEEEVAPLPSNLPIIKNNGQVYTYPDGKSGMGECEDLRLWWTASPVRQPYVLIPFLQSCPLRIFKVQLEETYSSRVEQFVSDLFTLSAYHLLVESK